MHRILDPESLGGLGLRRCQWYTTTLNEASQKASLRLGYTYEGTQRAARVLPLGKEGVRRESARHGGVDSMALVSRLSSLVLLVYQCRAGRGLWGFETSAVLGYSWL
jgi:hypothetical protein